LFGGIFFPEPTQENVFFLSEKKKQNKKGNLFQRNNRGKEVPKFLVLVTQVLIQSNLRLKATESCILIKVVWMGTTPFYFTVLNCGYSHKKETLSTLLAVQ